MLLFQTKYVFLHHQYADYRYKYELNLMNTKISHEKIFTRI